MPKKAGSFYRLREVEAWDLSSQGWTHKRIAEKLQVDRSTVTKILQRVSTKAAQNMLDEAIIEKMRQVELLRFVIDESLQAWERSKEAAKVATKKTSDKGEEITQQAKEQDGDPRYLSEARAAMADIRKILGLDHPLKLLQLDFGSLTDAQVDAIASGKDPFTVITDV